MSVEDLPALNEKQNACLQRYFTNGFKKSEAYRFAYDCSNMSTASIYVEASRFFKNPKITLWVEYYRQNTQKAVQEEINYSALDYFNDCEELFDITDIDGKTLTERAQEVESQWSIFSGVQTYKQLENILQKKGLPVYVIENIPQNYDTLGGMLIGNGFITTAQGESDPINYVNGKHTFIIQSTNFYDETEYLNVVNVVVKIKAAQNGYAPNRRLNAAATGLYTLRRKNAKNNI